MSDEVSATYKMQDPFIGRVLADKYRLDEFVGGGAMGRVYRATQVLLDKTVAVKLLHMTIAADERGQARFLREARAASRLDHPNSVQIFDFGVQPDGTMYLVMEFLSGRDLFRVIREDAPLPPRRIIDVISQALGALSMAHDAGIIHRDLKPENIMLVARPGDDGNLVETVKVADFGIARLVDPGASGDARLTSAGLVSGTPAYMSPEQIQGREIDGRSDLYAIGVILYEMVTGRLPFTADSSIAVVLKHLTEPAPPPSKLAPGCDPRLEALILRAMAKAPEDRFASAREMRAALRALLDDPSSLRATAPAALASMPAPATPTLSEPRPAVTTTPTPGARTPAMLLVAGAAAVSAIGVLVATVVFTGRDRSPRAAPPPAAAVTAPVAPTPPAPVAAPVVVPPAPVVAPPAPVVAPVVEAPPSPREVRNARVPARGSARARTTPPEPVAAPPPSTPVAAPAPTPAPAPAPVAAPAPPTPAPVAAPAPAPPAPPALRGVTAGVEGLTASGGVPRGVLQARASRAADALGRCVTRSLQGARRGTSFDAPVTVRVTVDVRDRRLDGLRLGGGFPWVAADCAGAVRGAFEGDLPQAEDTEYAIRYGVTLAPVR